MGANLMGYLKTIIIIGGAALTLGGLYLLQNKEKQEKFLKWINSL
jgi:hypothetical protein